MRPSVLGELGDSERVLIATRPWADDNQLPAWIRIATTVSGTDQLVTPKYDATFGLVPVGFQGRGLPILGDADADGMLDPDDYYALWSHWGTSDATWRDGDFTGDGRVWTDDWNGLAMHFDLAIDPAATPSLDDWHALEAMVPEPFGGSISVTMLFLLRRGKRAAV